VLHRTPAAGAESRRAARAGSRAARLMRPGGQLPGTRPGSSGSLRPSAARRAEADRRPDFSRRSSPPGASG
jgi:hypothetical protein